MAKLISLNCPNCSAPIQVSEGTTRFFCMHCGTESVLIFSNGEYHPQLLSDIKNGVDRTAAELSLQRLPNEIHELEQILKVKEQDKRDVLSRIRHLETRITTKAPTYWLQLLTGTFWMGFFGLIIFFWLNWYLASIIPFVMILSTGGNHLESVTKWEEITKKARHELDDLKQKVNDGEYDKEINKISSSIVKKKELIEKNRRLLDSF